MRVQFPVRTVRTRDRRTTERAPKVREQHRALVYTRVLKDDECIEWNGRPGKRGPQGNHEMTTAQQRVAGKSLYNL